MPGEIERLRGIKNEALQSVTDLKRSVTELENTEDEALREVTVMCLMSNDLQKFQMLKKISVVWAYCKEVNIKYTKAASHSKREGSKKSCQYS